MKSEVLEQKYVVEFCEAGKEKTKAFFSFFETACNFLNQKIQENCKECSMYFLQTVTLESKIYASSK